MLKKECVGGRKKKVMLVVQVRRLENEVVTEATNSSVTESPTNISVGAGCPRPHRGGKKSCLVAHYRGEPEHKDFVIYTI